MVSSSIDALFLGSIPLSSNEEVFATISTALNGRVKQIPDGETGPRANFIGCQYPVLPNASLQARWGGQAPADQTTLDAKSSDLNPIGYDDWAISSFAVFEDLQKSGKIPSDVRFQVSVPSAFGVVQGFVDSRFCAEIEPLYEEKLAAALARIQSSIPKDKLSLQFDLPFEIGALEYESGNITDPHWKAWFPKVQQGLIERLARLFKLVDEDVPLGLHLCYGDIGHVHFVDPKDTGILVQFIKAIHEGVEPIHDISYIHIPVPKDKTEAAYFEPLKSLEINPNTKLYLGVIHPNDEEGSKSRLEAARSAYHGPCGVSTECGLGRTPKEDLESIISIAKSLTT
ncbi:MAG: hypothetical protein GOMPHAMPRED_003191 [Gomphillus americanus]|uniref:Uncharacterized protein n=1 Tax=Gomphillus americanus TaxID=1940652 RepID=A0A8H3EGW1_9LECA|nr:MAG: hypothetical protein GOMPHAMPRED_003191 [Gomphillus americanus]